MASKAQNDEIIDPDGLDLFRLTMMVITASICGAIFLSPAIWQRAEPIPVRLSSRGEFVL